MYYHLEVRGGNNAIKEVVPDVCFMRDTMMMYGQGWELKFNIPTVMGVLMGMMNIPNMPKFNQVMKHNFQQMVILRHAISTIEAVRAKCAFSKMILTAKCLPTVHLEERMETHKELAFETAVERLVCVNSFTSFEYEYSQYCVDVSDSTANLLLRKHHNNNSAKK